MNFCEEEGNIFWVAEEDRYDNHNKIPVVMVYIDNVFEGYILLPGLWHFLMLIQRRHQ